MIGWETGVAIVSNVAECPRPPGDRSGVGPERRRPWAALGRPSPPQTDVVTTAAEADPVQPAVRLSNDERLTSKVASNQRNCCNKRRAK